MIWKTLAAIVAGAAAASATLPTIGTIADTKSGISYNIDSLLSNGNILAVSTVEGY